MTAVCLEMEPEALGFQDSQFLKDVIYIRLQYIQQSMVPHSTESAFFDCSIHVHQALNQ